MIAKNPDPYAAIERDLAAEDARLGEWPPPQWGAKDARCKCSDGIGSVTVEFGGVDDCPLLRDNHGRSIDIGRPLTRREGFWLTMTIAAVIVGLFGVAWLAVWVLGVVR